MLTRVEKPVQVIPVGSKRPLQPRQHAFCRLCRKATLGQPLDQLTLPGDNTFALHDVPLGYQPRYLTGSGFLACGQQDRQQS